MRVVTIIIVGLGLAACTVDQGPGGGTPTLGAHIAVQGEARVEVAPDRLAVRVTITQVSDNVADATAAVDRRAARALDAARAAGVEEADMRALSIRVQPAWDWQNGRRESRGHEASRTIELRLREIDRWPDLLHDLVQAGVDRIDSVEAEHGDRDSLAREALRAAVADARKRADVLADAAGTRITGVYSLTETQREWAAPMARADMMRAEAGPQPDAYQPGTITIISRVDAVFDLRSRR